MPLFKTEAVILQSRKFSETSKILVAFTREKGRMSVLVKGGRKGTKGFAGGLETLNRVEMQIYHKGGRELQNFKSSDLVDGYAELRKDLKRTYTALSLAEVAVRGTETEDPHADLYRALVETLEVLDRTGENPWSVRWNGLLRFCRELGFGMALQECRQCGSKTGPVKGFDLERGGFLCGDCKLEKPHQMPMPGESWGVLRFLDTCRPEAAARMAVHADAGRRIEALFNAYFRYHLPGLRGFDSWKMLPQLYWE
ncbi:MAG: DNA repair protein RecO [Candidatus Zixiibacteriota bacterium]|nr:MAG: DNA repair protein RecO [candidate division Zixibacteria bacterium]